MAKFNHNTRVNECTNVRVRCTTYGHVENFPLLLDTQALARAVLPHIITLITMVIISINTLSIRPVCVQIARFSPSCQAHVYFFLPSAFPFAYRSPNDSDAQGRFHGVLPTISIFNLF